MLLGRLEKDGSRKVGRLCLWSLYLPPSSLLLHAFATYLLSRLFFFFLCFTFFFCHSFSLLYVGVPIRQIRTEILTSPTCFDTVPLSWIKKLFTMLHCCLCFQSFLTFLTVPAALQMWCLKVFYSPKIHIAVCFIPPTWQADGVNFVVLRICYLHNVWLKVPLQYINLVYLANFTQGIYWTWGLSILQCLRPICW